MHLIPSQEAVFSYHSFWIMPLMKMSLFIRFGLLIRSFRPFILAQGLPSIFINLRGYERFVRNTIVNPIQLVFILSPIIHAT